MFPRCLYGILALALSLPPVLLVGPGLGGASAQPIVNAAPVGRDVSVGTEASVVVALDQRTPDATVEPNAEHQLLTLLNGVRQEHGLAPLRMDRSLQAAARAHSRDMATGGFVGHGNLFGVSAIDRLSHVVVRGLVGENVTFAVSCHAANRALVASSAHLANILEPRFSRVGIGVFSAGGLGMAVTQDFAE